MKFSNIYSVLFLAIALLTGTIGLTSCNAKSETEEIYTPSSSVAVTSFSLKSNRNVANNLDSVFFSIDLDHKVIYNADSLPKGTRTDKLIPVITYPSSVSGATIIMNGTRLKSEVDYKKNPSDTLDFSGLTLLRLTAEDGVTTVDYEIKVNVHKMNPDSLYWAAMATTTLPSRRPNPIAQKTVLSGNNIVTLVKEDNQEYTVATTSDIFRPSWNKQAVTAPKELNVSSFTATGSGFYILAEDGELMQSDDALNWTGLATKWNCIIGSYDDSLLGIRTTAGGLVHASWPAGKYEETALEENFPVSGASNTGLFETKWASDPVIILFGGVTSKGETSSYTWGFDGTSWAVISDNAPSPLSNATLISYIDYKSTNAQWIHLEFPVRMLVGGTLPNGSTNRKVYISYNNGVNWREADSGLQLPASFPAISAADAIVLSAEKESLLSNAWKLKMNIADKKRQATVEGDKVMWDAPYIFIFGGYGPNGKLNTEIWQGVLGRVLGTPLF